MFNIQFAKHVFYTGRVQGVGFRYAVKQIAKGFDVTGWVRNLADGRVELLAQSADLAELNAFFDEIEVNSAVSHHIKEKLTQSVPPQAGILGFSILA